MLKKYAPLQDKKHIAIKAMVMAAFTPLLINNQAQAENINPAEYVSEMYGNENGAKEKYYKFVTNDNNDYSTVEVSDSTDADFSVKYAPPDYTDGSKINDTLSTSNTNKVLFSIDGTSSRWGAIYNSHNNQNVDINADFVDNHQATTQNDIEWNKYGAAVSNYKGSIGNITGNFIENTAEINSGSSAINNFSGQINNISGNFIRNNSISNTFGGAIFNGTANNSYTPSYIESITDSNFIDNYCISPKFAIGGAITIKIGTINKISNSNFINNHVNATNDVARGAAIALGNNDNEPGTIKNLQANFLGNYGVSQKSQANGGAISIRNKYSSIEKLSGNFIGNYAKSVNNAGVGGAIWNQGTINEIKDSNFTNNHASGRNAYGGAIYNNAEIGSLTAEFTENNVTGETAQGGAIHNEANINEIQNSNFTNNYAKSETGEAKGGAIYTTKDLNIVAQDGYASNFEGNYVEDKDGKRPEAIYVDNNATLTLDANTNGKFVFNDQINGASQYKLKLKGDSSGKIYFNNDIKNADIEHNDVTTYVNGAKYLNQPDALNSLAMNSGTMNIGTLAPVPLHFDTFGMNGGTINIDSVDVDLANKTMGRITANNYTGEGKGTINVKAMNIVSDAKGLITPVEFADKSFKNTVKTEVKEAYTPIYKYDVEYDTEQRFNQENDNGYFVFKRSVRPSGGDEPTPAPTPENFNPAVIASPVATQMGANTAMNEALRFAFEHGDTFMNFSSMDRFAQINQNTYAMAGNNPLLSTELTSSPRRGKHISLGGEKNLLANNSELTNSREGKLALSTDFNENLSYTDLSHENKSVWVKPYSVFEKIDLKNGPKVDTISYGTLVGFDSNIHKMKKGWYNVGTAYIGYNGSQIDYKGVDASMNGGLLGLTETFYKGNFWTAITATAGAGVAEAHTMYGKDDMTMLMAGIGSKTGYNFEFADGKFIIQPRMFISYSMINTFDYTNAAGVRIDSDPMHTIQLNPAIKFIGNTKNGWQPYASVGMMWNLLNETETTANGVKLPEMHTKPYVEYGVGIQKLWNDKYSAYGQAMVRNGGRTGVALTLGFRMALGNDGKPIERTQKDKQILKQVQNDNSKQILNRVQNDSAERKVLKQLSPTQKAHLMQTTRTSMNGVVR